MVIAYLQQIKMLPNLQDMAWRNGQQKMIELKGQKLENIYQTNVAFTSEIEEINKSFKPSKNASG